MGLTHREVQRLLGGGHSADGQPLLVYSPASKAGSEAVRVTFLFSGSSEIPPHPRPLVFRRQSTSGAGYPESNLVPCWLCWRACPDWSVPRWEKPRTGVKECDHERGPGRGKAEGR